MRDSKQTMPMAMIPRRKITGISAVLLPFTEDGVVDWPGCGHIERTVEAGNAIHEACNIYTVNGRTITGKDGDRFIYGKRQNNNGQRWRPVYGNSGN